MEVREGDRVTNRPEPDVVVLRTPVRRIPFGTDVSLAIEVSDTTQADDFGAKVGLYARAGVAEYWVLDLPRRRLVAFRRLADDAYAVRAEFTESDTLAAEIAPSLPVRLADLLPPAE